MRLILAALQRAVCHIQSHESCILLPLNYQMPFLGILTDSYSMEWPWKQLTTWLYPEFQHNPPARSIHTSVWKWWEVKQFYHLLERDRLWKHWHWYLCLYAEGKIINFHAHNCLKVANHFSNPKWSASFQRKITFLVKLEAVEHKAQPSATKQVAQWSPGASHWPLPQRTSPF